MTGTDSYFARFFAAIDGEDPYSALDLVADELEFSIIWAADTGPKSRQFVGGTKELRDFIDAGDRQGWAHYLLSVNRQGSIEIALGETRWDDGTHIGTFIAAAQLDAAGRMVRYQVSRSPALRFDASPVAH